MDNAKMTKPKIGSKWRHYKTGAAYEVAAGQCDRNIKPIKICSLSAYAHNSLALPLHGELWRLLSERYDNTLVFYSGESGRWCRSLEDFCGAADNGEKRFVEVE
jgi:hypothetical protein